MSLMLLDYRDLPTEGARILARTLHDYDDNLELVKLAPGHPYFDPDAPFAVLYRRGTPAEYVVDGVKKASQLDERLFGRILELDTRRSGKRLDKFAALDWARMVLSERERADRRGELEEQVKYAHNKRRWE